MVHARIEVGGQKAVPRRRGKVPFNDATRLDITQLARHRADGDMGHDGCSIQSVFECPVLFFSSEQHPRKGFEPKIRRVRKRV